MKFLHFADLHLDMPFNSSGLTAQKAQLRRKDLMDTFFRIIEIANTQKVDALLICGDLFEHDYVKKSTISLINDAFMGIPHIKVFIVPGNHDPYIPNSFYSSFMWARNVNIFTKDLKFFTIPEHDTCLYGVGFGNFYEEKSLIFDLGSVDSSKINIFMTHGTVDMNFGKSMYNPMSGVELAGLAMDYIALGHFHKRFESYDNV
ncbi:MAG TPA: DNA repair exonuclease, partial [Clostridia bacterium]